MQYEAGMGMGGPSTQIKHSRNMASCLGEPLDKREPSSIQSIHWPGPSLSPLILLQSASWRAHLSTEPSPISAHLSREKRNPWHDCIVPFVCVS